MSNLGSVEFLDHDNDDLTVVNAARESFNKRKISIDDADVKLINYLARHKHWTPFGHIRLVQWREQTFEAFTQSVLAEQDFVFSRVRIPSETSNVNTLVVGSLYSFAQARLIPESPKLKHSTKALVREFPSQSQFTPLVNVSGLPANDQLKLLSATFRFRMPIFVERQWSTHKQHFLIGKAEAITRNEISGRYVKLDLGCYRPSALRLRAENVKQGSSDQTIDRIGSGEVLIHDLLRDLENVTTELYECLLRYNIAPELARMTLPLSTHTEFWETGSLAAWKRLCNLRLDPHAQKEVQWFAQQVNGVLGEKFPNVWGDV